MSSPTDTGIGPSVSVDPSSDSFDMFADDDGQTTANPSSEERNLVSGGPSGGADQPLSNTNTNSESKLLFL